MSYFVPASGFSQQIAEFTKQLAWLADQGIEIGDEEHARTRATSFYVEIPDPQSGVTTTFDYREEFERVEGGWLRSRYVYEFRRSQPKGAKLHSRRAHHEHGIWKVHQHCQTPASQRSAHYRDVERLLQATHEIFERLFADAVPIECSGLVPLTASPR